MHDAHGAERRIGLCELCENVIHREVHVRRNVMEIARSVCIFAVRQCALQCDVDERGADLDADEIVASPRPRALLDPTSNVCSQVNVQRASLDVCKDGAPGCGG